MCISVLCCLYAVDCVIVHTWMLRYTLAPSDCLSGSCCCLQHFWRLIRLINAALHHWWSFSNFTILSSCLLLCIHATITNVTWIIFFVVMDLQIQSQKHNLLRTHRSTRDDFSSPDANEILLAVLLWKFGVSTVSWHFKLGWLVVGYLFGDMKICWECNTSALLEFSVKGDSNFNFNLSGTNSQQNFCELSFMILKI